MEKSRPSIVFHCGKHNLAISLELIRRMVAAVPTHRESPPQAQCRDRSDNVLGRVIGYREMRAAEFERMLDHYADEQHGEHVDLQAKRAVRMQRMLPTSSAHVRLASCDRLGQSLTCPITANDIMTHPVVAPDGHTYERNAIVRWLSENNPRTAIRPCAMTAARVALQTGWKKRSSSGHKRSAIAPMQSTSRSSNRVLK